jgi:hypothetical protein
VLLDGHGWKVVDELPSFGDDCGWKDLPRLIYTTGDEHGSMPPRRAAIPWR